MKNILLFSLFLNVCMGCLFTDEKNEPPAPLVFVDGYTLKTRATASDSAVNYIIKGVCWSPYNKGRSTVAGHYPNFTSWVGKDADLMKAANINTVRLYRPLKRTQESLDLLDTLYDHGIRVIMTVYSNHRWEKVSDGIEAVRYFKSHPALLLWAVGNEINNNNLYSESPNKLDLAGTITVVNDVVAQVKSADSQHAIVVSWGNPLDNYGSINQLQGDIISIQLYIGESFKNTFSNHKANCNKPLYISEYGADSYNMLISAEDLVAHAHAVESTTKEIRDNLSATRAGEGVTIGGTIFEWNDEWWKYSGGTAWMQDTNTLWVAVGENGPYPDNAWQEEYFGIVDIDRNPKPAYNSLKAVYATY